MISAEIDRKVLRAIDRSKSPSGDSVTEKEAILFYQQLLPFVDSSLKRVKAQTLQTSISKAIAGQYNDSVPVEEINLEDRKSPQRNILNENYLTRYRNTVIKTDKEAKNSSPTTAIIVDDSAIEIAESPSINSKKKRKDRSDLINTNGQPLPRRKKKGSPDVESQKSTKLKTENITLADIGGLEDSLESIQEFILMPLLHPEYYAHLGTKPPRGVLLHGPPGCGKTMLAHAIGNELSSAHNAVSFHCISAPEIIQGVSGESERKVREIFNEAIENAPSLLFIDEIDAITPKRENVQREMERRIVAQILTCMDELNQLWMAQSNDNQNDATEHFKMVMVMGATNRPDSIDAALRRAGRFDKEICIGVPNEEGRERILQSLCIGMKLSEELDYKKLAKLTPGYVGADLQALVSAAGLNAIKRLFIETAVKCNNDENEMIVDDDMGSMQSSLQKFLKEHPKPLTSEQLQPLSITLNDFISSIPKIQPSSKREGFSTVPDTTWADVGALQHVRLALNLAIVQPIQKPEYFKTLGILAPAGVLLWGPPGCGKTLLAKAVANESKANFVAVKGPELLNKYVGESERAVRQVFQRAKASAPCVIFFDEIDALVPRRTDALSESSARVVNTLLTELDGMNDRNGVFVIAATNRPDIIDPAMMRPGRLEKRVYIDLPNALERIEILRTVCRKTPLSSDVDLNLIASDSRAEGYSGADINSVMREAALNALKRSVFSNLENTEMINSTAEIQVKAIDFHNALDHIQPSVSFDERRRFLNLKQQYERYM